MKPSILLTLLICVLVVAIQKVAALPDKDAATSTMGSLKRWLGGSSSENEREGRKQGNLAGRRRLDEGDPTSQPTSQPSLSPCHECVAGEYWSRSDNDCYDCTAGNYCTGGCDSQSACDAGTYQVCIYYFFKYHLANTPESRPNLLTSLPPTLTASLPTQHSPAVHRWTARRAPAATTSR